MAHKMKKNKTKTQHNIYWTPLYANKHKQRKQDMIPPTNKHKQRQQDMVPPTNKHKQRQQDMIPPTNN